MNVLRGLLSYGIFSILVAIAAIVSTVLVRQRRRDALSRRDVNLAGFVRTDEVTIDPTTGIAQRVWFNPSTGERRYVAIDPPQRS